jgi:hypothetical protein
MNVTIFWGSAMPRKNDNDCSTSKQRPAARSAADLLALKDVPVFKAMHELAAQYPRYG